MNKPGNRLFYSFGIRGEYTIDTNLDLYNSDSNNIFFPSEDFLKRFIFGINVGGGFEFPFGEFTGGFIEITALPDFSKQYFRPPVQNVQSPFNPGQRVNLSEESIVNISLEISIGIRFTHRIEYIDDYDDDELW